MSISAVAMCEGGATVYGRVWYQNVQQSRRAPLLQFSLHSIEGAVREDTERVTLRPGLHIALALHCRKWE